MQKQPKNIKQLFLKKRVTVNLKLKRVNAYQKRKKKSKNQKKKNNLYKKEKIIFLTT